MKKLLMVGLVLAAGGMLAWAQDGDGEHEKKSIKEVMKAAHGGGPNSLLSKVKGGEASDEEKDQLLDLYLDLFESEPPMGEQEGWMMLSGRAVLAAAKVAVGRPGAEELLGEATNCAECHKAHKPPADN